MYKISVPMVSDERVRDPLMLEELRKFDAQRVFLSIDVYVLDEKKRKEQLDNLRINCEYLKNLGYEVGAWVWTFMFREKHPFRSMKDLNGTEVTDNVCPTDVDFCKFAADYIKDIAKIGVDMIMFDDDFRYGFLSDWPCCLCDEHIARINKITSENKDISELKEHILSGGRNKFRDAWLKVNGETFEDFARIIRKAVDEINKNIRVGFCACLSSWDIDGTSPEKISRLLAGNTKPFLRLIGAPYWAVSTSWGCWLPDIIELERMESSWCRADDIEIFSEGDVYPRPRSIAPASYLEIFDTALRASGCTDGILKYGIDYRSNPEYETGYALRHVRNRENYKLIDKYFGEKTNAGVRVYEYPKKIADMVAPNLVNKENDFIKMFFSMAARTTSWNCIPTVYEGRGIAGIAFDENARHLPDCAFENGLIIDIAAAKILHSKGVDVGIENFGDMVKAGDEKFLKSGNKILTGGISVCDIKLNTKAEILSETITENCAIAMSYRYENADGHRFLVLNMNTRELIYSNHFTINPLRHYDRGRQIVDNIKWLSGQTLPATCVGHPSLYMQCKEGNGALAVGLWNAWADEVISPEIKLNKRYNEISFINCTGSLYGDVVRLSDISAFDFAGFEVRQITL
jgi:hypothetical protein